MDKILKKASEETLKEVHGGSHTFISGVLPGSVQALLHTDCSDNIGLNTIVPSFVDGRLFDSDIGHQEFRIKCII